LGYHPRTLSEPSIISVGNFDGVHIGHQAILRTARELADEHGAGVTAVTFDPPPVALLKPDHHPPQVASTQERARWLRKAGADRVVVLRPDRAMLALSAEAFVDQLVREHHAVGFVEGDDFRFGHKRGGDMALLAELGAQRGLAVRALGRVTVGLSDQSTAPVSSSLVRWLVGRGRMRDVSACLGRSWEATAAVVKGEQRGRTIGIPTANLDMASLAGRILPMDGVYAGEAVLEDGAAYPAAISVGTKPTFGERRLTIEAHLIGYEPAAPDGLYGRPLTIRFARWIRDQYPFPNADDLVTQLRRDIRFAALTAAGGSGEGLM
jgi:riboflavin kinase/FMN adenylyltransferase